ncbi:MAG: UvrD-helicase domain-containing protein [Bacteroidia bacterium]
MKKTGLAIYRASAGSGKTFTLVFSYLKIVVREPYLYRHVLAITFTNKATDEMKSRIIKELSALGKGEVNAMYEALSQHFSGLNLKIDIHKNASIALNHILKDYGNFSVCTIESFCQRVIRAFAKELNVPLGYDIEMRNEVVLNKITDDVFLEAGQNAKLTQLLQGFVESKMDQDKTWKIDKEIKELGHEIFKERYQRYFREKEWNEIDYTEEMFKLSQEIWEIRRNFESELQRIARKGWDKMQSLGIVVDDFARKGQGAGAYFERIAFSNQLETNKLEANNYVKKGYEDPEELMSKPSKETKARKEMIMPSMRSDIHPILCELINYYDNHLIDYISAVEASKTIYTFGLLNDLQKKLGNYRRENRQLLISDTNQLLNNLLQGMDTPFVYEKLGNRYFYYLLDEFQDTSEMQWENLYPLIHNALSSIYDDESMIVGDVKQSIYRWRGGDLMLLKEKVQQRIALDNLEELIRPETLENNWRTAAEVVYFNNDFFQKSAALLGETIRTDLKDFFVSAYDDVVQIPQRTAYPGFVSIDFFTKKGQSSGWKEDAKQRTLEIIQSLEHDGYNKSDITILVRTNKESADIAEFLQENRIKITSAESLLLANHPVVKMLVALLCYLQDNRDTLSGATAGYYYHVFTQAEQKEIALEEIVEPNWDEVFQDNGKYKLPEYLEKKRIYLLTLPLYECVEQLLRISPSLMQPNVYIQGFLDTVLEYNSKNDGGVSGFLSWWEDVKVKKFVVSASDKDAVQIMTVHKSKGLEFPIVIMPFANWSFEPKEDSVIWIQPEVAPYSKATLYPLKYSKRLENTHFYEDYLYEKVFSYLDNLNVLYVAFTRPEYRLYILTSQKTKGEIAMGERPDISEVGTLLGWLVGNELDMRPEETTNENEEKKSMRYVQGKAISKSELLALKGKKEEIEVEMPASTLYQPLDLRENWSDIIRVKRFAQNFVAERMMEQAERVSVGNLLHTALGHIVYAEDVTKSVSILFQKGEINEEQCPELQALLEKVVKHPLANQWFSRDWKVRTEMELLGTSGKVFRPDRIMMKEKTAYVIDYKSGIPSESDAQQVKRYMRLLQKMSFTEVRGFVFYLSDNRVEEV